MRWSCLIAFIPFRKFNIIWLCFVVIILLFMLFQEKDAKESEGPSRSSKCSLTMLRSILHKHWFLFGIVFAIALAHFSPGIGAKGGTSQPFISLHFIASLNRALNATLVLNVYRSFEARMDSEICGSFLDLFQQWALPEDRGLFLCFHCYLLS